MTYDMTLPQPIVPALAPLYARLSRLSYPLIRATTGLMLMPHGAQKLFGWFGGYGLEGTGGFAPRVWVWSRACFGRHWSVASSSSAACCWYSAC